ncbi:MAG: hypothetical protein K2L95_00970 [Alphaproteobacteria bacterium]|nr:hypothetical protein [Alphaproteobacteria bacterium]
MHKIIVGLISALMVLCVGGVAHAAGYTCPTYKKYTSCNSGYYLNGTSAGNACVACSTVSFTESSTDSTTDSSACTATSQTVTSGYCKQNQVRSGSRTGTRSKTRTCYRTGGAGGTNGSSACTGSANCGAYSYGAWSYGSCTYTAWTNSGSVYDCSCPAGYYLSGTSCGACTSISFTDSGTDTGTDTSGCTATSQTVTVSISNGSYKQNQVRSGSRTWSRSKSRTCYRTGGAGGTNGSSACTGTGNCGSYTYGSYSYGSCSYGAWSNSGSAYGYSCNAGYYWNGSACAACTAGNYCPGFSNVNSPSAGYGLNSCTNAPANANYTGSSTSNSCAWSCNAGYYGSSAAGSTSCAACGQGNYCTGGTHRATCASTVPAGAATPTIIRSLSSGSWSDLTHGASIYDCMCDWYFSDETRTQYMNERSCTYGPGGNNYTKYEWCRTGYYASNPLNFNNWYNSCSPCTNAPANATYTSYSTPSTMYAVESNCPWQCNANYYQNGTTCTACNSGYTSPAGSTAASSCTKSCTRACTQQTCPTSAYSCTHGSTSTTGTDAQGVGCNAAASTCSLTINSCKNGYYKDGNACSACPSTHPNSADGTTGGSGACWKSCTRACTQPACPANATCTYGTTSTSGTETYGGSCSAATSTCSVTVTCNPGYYKNSSGTCTACEDGYFCPGNNTRTACTTLGAGYTKSDGARSANTHCYQDCSKACTTAACGTGVNACTHASTSTSGTQHYQGTCTAAASTCAQTVTNCASGYYKNGNACSACSSLGDQTYTNSANANSSGSGVCYKSCANSNVSNGYIPPTSATVNYPATCAYNAASTVCNTGYSLTSSNVCAAMCAAGVTKIRTGNVTVPLYASKQTTPALHVSIGGKVCYGSLDSDAGTSAINVNYGGKTYHSIK